MSSDILTQLQTCYDQLLTQFFATLSYLSQRHPLVAPDPDPNDPFTNPPPGLAVAGPRGRGSGGGGGGSQISQPANPPPPPSSAGDVTVHQQQEHHEHPEQQHPQAAAVAVVNPGPEDTERAPFPLHPVPAATFARAQRELAEDLVLKGQQIEMLITRLPGIGRGAQEQADEVAALADQVRTMEQERRARRRELKDYAARLERVVMAMSVNVDYDDNDGGANGGQG
ncbi:hypothetical protein AYL99_09857 [Fonsecaea erecta]|uniref:Mediator of RNA polymerase II transcription subunit 21 n=1 Tax=Fonsecaea erecta TaxID=1367422 RepID=A0A178Z9H0_9EURO|nr:hypothetical protein AYL99_09857 [Fonsecaea erecta]OAP55705.1 hypothetical protein AYL99_09857 [Fonsecaea erecta]